MTIRLASLVIGILFIIVPYIIQAATNIEVVGDDCLTTYYSSLEESSCDVTIITNKETTLDSSSKFEVEFFDKNGISLGIFESGYIIDDGTKHEATIFDIPGDVAYYEILDCDLYPSSGTAEIVMWSLTFPIFVFFFLTLLLNYKHYNILGNDIIVYAGFFNHYIKINGIITDEHNTLITFVPIYLSCVMGTDNMIQVRITTFNRISLQCNNMLVQPN